MEQCKFDRQNNERKLKENIELMKVQRRSFFISSSDHTQLSYILVLVDIQTMKVVVKFNDIKFDATKNE